MMPDRAELLKQLRAANEQTVIDALDSCYVCEHLEGIAPVVLLEFYQRMNDVILGPPED